MLLPEDARAPGLESIDANQMLAEMLSSRALRKDTFSAPC